MDAEGKVYEAIKGYLEERQEQLKDEIFKNKIAAKKTFVLIKPIKKKKLISFIFV